MDNFTLPSHFILSTTPLSITLDNSTSYALFSCTLKNGNFYATRSKYEKTQTTLETGHQRWDSILTNRRKTLGLWMLKSKWLISIRNIGRGDIKFCFIWTKCKIVLGHFASAQFIYFLNFLTLIFNGLPYIVLPSTLTVIYEQTWFVHWKHFSSF